MNKLTIINNKKRLDIIIKHYKCVIGKDELTKDLIEQTICNYFNKLNLSEYALENEVTYELLLDDQRINVKDYDFYHITPYFNLESDKKLNSKSLSLAYIVSLLENVEYKEQFQTIELLMNSIFEDLDFIFDKEFIRPVFNIEFTKKELIKFLEFEFSKDESIINNYDLNLHERIRLQLLMVKEIARKSNNKTFIYLNTPHLTCDELEIIKQINGFKVLSFETTDTDNIDNLFIVQNDIIIDTLDDNAIFDLCNNYSSHITIEEMKNKLIKDHLIRLKI